MSCIIFNVITLFPEMFGNYLNLSIIGRAQKKGLIQVNLTNFRKFTCDKHNTVDDSPYGGGEGMIVKPEPLTMAIEKLSSERPRGLTILLGPQGRRFCHKMAVKFAQEKRLILICGRYEGIDERVRKLKIDQELSLGDFVLSGGELAALSVIDTVSRLIPGVLGGDNSAKKDSFANGLMKHPLYTRPYNFKGLEVPKVLLSGNHSQIKDWRLQESLKRTLKYKINLLKKKSNKENRTTLNKIIKKNKEKFII